MEDDAKYIYGVHLMRQFCIRLNVIGSQVEKLDVAIFLYFRRKPCYHHKSYSFNSSKRRINTNFTQIATRFISYYVGGRRRAQTTGGEGCRIENLSFEERADMGVSTNQHFKRKMEAFNNRTKSMWLVISDGGRKWIEVYLVTSKTESKTNECLYDSLGRFDIAKTIVTDEGDYISQCNSTKSCKVQDIYQVKTHRITQDRTVGEKTYTHSESMLRRKLRRAIENRRPSMSHNVDKATLRQKYFHDRGISNGGLEDIQPVWKKINKRKRGKFFENTRTIMVSEKPRMS
ncbi:hypothetical protein RF11_10868 [Thelohanellus kitauei]|uniref:Uncharacterized protein n=1 Tax=Thelohanellus kitauei TaxID=669202 RepID=A0A0C2IZF2_THEKT|nr:hypothetical protein RF11_10868 [Thelohanellus kitauei]